MKPFTLAMVQMLVAGGDLRGNLARAQQRIAQASEAGADVVLLPETMDLGWTHPSALSGATAVPDGEACLALREAARRHKRFVCAGLTERDGEHVYNAAVLIDPSGGVMLCHRKLNELEIGHPFYDQGDRLAVAKTPFGTLGVMICADAFAHEYALARSLGYMGADVILSPSAWAVPADHDNAREPYGELWRKTYCAVAQDFSLWIAGVSNVGPMTGGPWQGWNCIGCSLLVDPHGQPVLQGRYGADADEILYARIQPMPRPARGGDWPKHWAKKQA